MRWTALILILAALPEVARAEEPGSAPRRGDVALADATAPEESPEADDEPAPAAGDEVGEAAPEGSRDEAETGEGEAPEPPPFEEEFDESVELELPRAEERAAALLELAREREAAGDGGLAIEALERFLETNPFDPRAARVQAALFELRKAPTRVRVESPHTEASVWIGGTKVADRTPAELSLPAGRHRVVVTARDGRSRALDLVVPPASRRQVEVIFPGDFDPLVQQRFGAGESLVFDVPGEEGEGDEEAEKRKRRRVVALAGLSSSALVLTGVFGMIALSEAESFRREPSERVARRGERAAILADVSLGVALASGVAALVLKLKDRKEKAAAKVSLSPTLDRSGAGLLLRGAL